MKENTYFSKYKYNKKNPNFIIIFIVIFIVLFFSVFLFLLFKNSKKTSFVVEKKGLYNKLFSDKNYLELLNNMDFELKKNPLQIQYLIYRGYCYFLLSEDEADVNIKKKHLIHSLQDLRKVIAVDSNNKNISNIYFTIGKIYYQLGEFYYLQSLKYLKLSKDLKNNRVDLYYLLGVLYLNLGRYKDSINIYQEALNKGENELILLALSNAYYNENDFNNAKKYLLIIKDKYENLKVKEKALFLLGEIYFKENNYDEALNCFNKVLEINDNNAEAYFYRGEIFNLYKNYVQARFEWRRALEIDPSHIKAINRLY